MYGVFAAESAIFVHFKPVRRVFLVLCGVVVSLLAVIAAERYFNSHSGTSLFTSLPVCFDKRKN
jgi:hypothetical protein